MKNFEKKQINSCPICMSLQQVPIEPYNGYDMMRCMGCSMVYTADRIIPVEEYENFYKIDNGYGFMIRDAEKAQAGTYGLKDLWWFKRRALNWLAKKKVTGRLLDVGCGAGTFLIVAKGLGWTVTGVEPTQAAAETASRFGLEVYHGYVEEYEKHTNIRFDVITCFEVLEHVANPIAILRSIKNLLKPGGLLIISVPNADDPYCLLQQHPHTMPPIHINFFNKRSLHCALEKAGIESLDFYSLPIPTGSIRRIYGQWGFIWRLPILVLKGILGQVDGSTLLSTSRSSRSKQFV